MSAHQRKVFVVLTTIILLFYHIFLVSGQNVVWDFIRLFDEKHQKEQENEPRLQKNLKTLLHWHHFFKLTCRVANANCGLYHFTT